MSTIAERVAAGVAWLDENRPDWWLDVDLDKLVLSSPCRCVLGQLYGEYEDAPIVDVNTDDEVAVAHGFNAGGHDHPAGPFAEFAALESEWRRVITERRAAA